ncbi:DUF2267 domain-containing protein [Halococcus sediminicola]|uniref:DUF2267 domain-containing protein n=1 Tax=Halococcus sediminicola TaxID=1264579 RepID=UPI001929E84B|nr:DUF2267 domain-containing protein [Halococcus sediminicola]
MPIDSMLMHHSPQRFAMDHDTFIGKVQNRAELPSRGAALGASRATLQTLGDRIQEGEATNLAAQLSDELGRFLEEHAKTTESFSFDEFIERVADRDENFGESDDGNDLSAATFHARVVVDVLEDAVSGGQLDDLRNQLPDEYGQLFELADAEEHPGQE